MSKITEQAGYKSADEKPGFVLSKTSLDAQVKSYLQRFEEEAVALTENFFGAQFRDQGLFESVSPLFEQGDLLDDILGDEDGVGADETDQPAAEQPSEDAMAADVEITPRDKEGGANDMGGELPVDVPDVTPRIDIEGFGQNVMSLIETAQHKLDFENAIMNLSIKHLKDQYGQDVAQKLLNFFEGMGYNFVVQDDQVIDPQG